MAKQSLGRDLGTIMGRKPKEGAAPVGAGIGSLMRGHNPPAPTLPSAPTLAPAPTFPPTPTPKPLVPRWYLLAGDVLLVALALLTLYKSPHPLSWQREVFCAALVMLAALLAVIALLMPDAKAANLPAPNKL